MSVTVGANSDQIRLIEANLCKLLDVERVRCVDTTGAPGHLLTEGTMPSRPMKAIYVITTGGTIEKAYSEQTGSVANFDSRIDRYLRMLRLPYSDVHVIALLNKDSLEMMDTDRKLVLGTVTALLPEGAPIIITHGTDTVVQTGLYLQQEIPELKVPIVLTGAMTPLGFDGSDGLQNLTESLFAVRLLKAGVFLVIHNEAFPIYRVRKDHALGRFVWTDTKVM